MTRQVLESMKTTRLVFREYEDDQTSHRDYQTDINLVLANHHNIFRILTLCNIVKNAIFFVVQIFFSDALDGISISNVGI